MRHGESGTACTCIEAPGSRTRCCDRLRGLSCLCFMFTGKLVCLTYGNPVGSYQYTRREQKGILGSSRWVGSRRTCFSFSFSKPLLLCLGATAQLFVGDLNGRYGNFDFALGFLIISTYFQNHLYQHMTQIRPQSLSFNYTFIYAGTVPCFGVCCLLVNLFAFV